MSATPANATVTPRSTSMTRFGLLLAASLRTVTSCSGSDLGASSELLDWLRLRSAGIAILSFAESGRTRATCVFHRAPAESPSNTTLVDRRGSPLPRRSICRPRRCTAIVTGRCSEE